MNFKEVFNYDNMYKAYKKCILGVSWKGTVQNYKSHSISMIQKTLKELESGKFKSGNFYKFTIFERGKEREIKSVNIQERVVQRCLCDNCLVPILTPKLIYDNYACVKGKGYHFAIKRMKHFLHKYYLKHKTNEGYILQFDFSKYFDNIPHKELIKMLSEHIKDKELFALTSKLINDFEGEKGLGLGSQISQICAIYYPNYLDHYFTTKKELFAYGRYMDDGFMISDNKELLKEYRKKLIDIVENKLKLKINLGKTNITKLSRSFTFLKARFLLTNNGKIIVKPCKTNIVKNRRKIKKLIKKGIDTENIFKSIFNNYDNFNAYKTKQSYKNIYMEEIKKYEKN